MKNRFMVALLSLVAIFAFSNLASAQDPEGTLDNLSVDCKTNIYPGSGTAVATFDIIFSSDNTGGNKIAGMAIPLTLYTVGGDSCIVSADTTVAGVFTGTVVSAFSILSVTEESFAPNQVNITLGAVSFVGGITGTGVFAHLNLTINDTCCIVIDTTHTALIPDPNFITELALGFIPGWSGPDTCCIEPYVNQNPVVNCGGPNRAVFAGGIFSHDVLANDPDDPNDICDLIVSCTYQFLDSLYIPIGPADVAPCGVATLGPIVPGPNISDNFTWNTAGCPGGIYYVVFTYTDECGGSGADTCCYEIKTACAFVTIGEVTADPCQ